MNATILHTRYPGIRSFERTEQELFFGRSEEIRSLYAQIKVLHLAVMFAKSGIGKSSLLNAGVLPLLELEPFVPIRVRFQDGGITPVEAVKAALQPFLDEALLHHQLGRDAAADAGMWEYLRSCRFERYGEPAVPVFVFDQFEEFFEHPTETQKKLIVDLADLVSDRLPNRVRDHLLSIPVAERSAEDMGWHQPVAAKFVLAIRSDRLSLLDNLSVEIPLILHNRYQLRPLQRLQARDAVVEPAVLPGPEFATPAFTYSPDTLQLILNELTNKNQEIESFQLQLVCQYIEQQVQGRAAEANGTGIEIDQTFLRSSDDIQAILNDYYEQAIAALPDTLKECARNFIETGLIISGRRVGLTEGVEQERYGIQPDLLKLLIDSRLIRVENTHLGRSYEISHDTLVPAITKSYEKRRRILEQAALEQERQDREHELAEELRQRTQEQRLRQERLLRRRTYWFAAAATILAILAFSAFRIANIQNGQAQLALKNYELAELARQEADEGKKSAELQLYRTKVDVYLNAGQPLLARRELELASAINPHEAWIKDKRTEIENLLHQTKR